MGAAISAMTENLLRVVENCTCHLFLVQDNSIADMLYRKVRVLCWIMTSPTGLNEKAIHSYRTWGRRCNKLLVVSSAENSSFPVPVISKSS